MKVSAATPLASRSGLCRTGSRYSKRRTTRRLVRSPGGQREHAEEGGREEQPPRKVGPIVAPKREKLACEGTILRNPKIHIRYQSGFTSGVPARWPEGAQRMWWQHGGEEEQRAEHQQQELTCQQRLIGPERHAEDFARLGQRPGIPRLGVLLLDDDQQVRADDDR